MTLKLNAETLRALSADQASHVEGGREIRVSYWPHYCMSDEISCQVYETVCTTVM